MPTRQITLGTSPYTFTNDKGEDVKGYWFRNPDGDDQLAVQDDNGRWQGVFKQDDGSYRAAGDVSFIPTQKIKDESGRESELVVTPNGNHWDNGYKSAYHPEDSVEFANILTAGGLNNLSPTQWLRRTKDAIQTAKGNMSGAEFRDHWLNGNNGIVSDQFAENHPYLSMAVNMAGDMGLGLTASASKNLAKTALKINRGRVYYSGSPLARTMPDGDIKIFDDFKDYKGQVWGSDNYNYAKAMSRARPSDAADGYDWEGAVHSFMVDPKELNTKTLPTGKGYSGAGQMPLKIDANGQLKLNSNGNTELYDVRTGKGNSIKPLEIEQPDEFAPDIQSGQSKPVTSQNQAVSYLFGQGADAVELPHMVDGDWFGNAFETNSISLRPNAPRYNISQENSKWSLFDPMFRQSMKNTKLTKPMSFVTSNRNN